VGKIILRKDPKIFNKIRHTFLNDAIVHSRNVKKNLKLGNETKYKYEWFCSLYVCCDS